MSEMLVTGSSAARLSGTSGARRVLDKLPLSTVKSPSSALCLERAVLPGDFAPYGTRVASMEALPQWSAYRRVPGGAALVSAIKGRAAATLQHDQPPGGRWSARGAAVTLLRRRVHQIAVNLRGMGLLWRGGLIDQAWQSAMRQGELRGSMRWTSVPVCCWRRQSARKPSVARLP